MPDPLVKASLRPRPKRTSISSRTSPSISNAGSCMSCHGPAPDRRYRCSRRASPTGRRAPVLAGGVFCGDDDGLVGRAVDHRPLKRAARRRQDARNLHHAAVGFSGRYRVRAGTGPNEDSRQRNRARSARFSIAVEAARRTVAARRTCPRNPARRNRPNAARYSFGRRRTRQRPSRPRVSRSSSRRRGADCRGEGPFGSSRRSSRSMRSLEAVGLAHHRVEARFDFGAIRHPGGSILSYSARASVTIFARFSRSSRRLCRVSDISCLRDMPRACGVFSGCYAERMSRPAMQARATERMAGMAAAGFTAARAASRLRSATVNPHRPGRRRARFRRTHALQRANGRLHASKVHLLLRAEAERHAAHIAAPDRKPRASRPACREDLSRTRGSDVVLPQPQRAGGHAAEDAFVFVRPERADVAAGNRLREGAGRHARQKPPRSTDSRLNALRRSRRGHRRNPRASQREVRSGRHSGRSIFIKFSAVRVLCVAHGVLGRRRFVERSQISHVLLQIETIAARNGRQMLARVGHVGVDRALNRAREAVHSRLEVAAFQFP